MRWNWPWWNLGGKADSLRVAILPTIETADRLTSTSIFLDHLELPLLRWFPPLCFWILIAGAQVVLLVGRVKLRSVRSMSSNSCSIAGARVPIPAKTAQGYYHGICVLSVLNKDVIELLHYGQIYGWANSTLRLCKQFEELVRKYAIFPGSSPLFCDLIC